MGDYALRRVRELAREDLDGYILKKDSPSCGMELVKVHDGAGDPGRTGRGLFADVLLSSLPHLPIDEEGRLQQPSLRENFIERVYAYARLRRLLAGPWSVRALLEFHAAHKLTLLVAMAFGAAQSSEAEFWK